MKKITSFVRDVYERVPPSDPGVWHKWNVLMMPVRTIDGNLTFGEVWRRRAGSSWSYQRRDMTDEEWWAAQ
jgi:hypothetical protein